jgi:hypothetical protein
VTKREAKRYVARMTARSVRHDIDNASGWIYAAEDATYLRDAYGRPSSEPSHDRSDADVARIEAAIDELASELERRSA